MPGDRIQMIDGLLHINGTPVKRERISDFIDDENGGSQRVKRWRETLPNGVSYETPDLQDNGFLDNTQVYNKGVQPMVLGAALRPSLFRPFYS